MKQVIRKRLLSALKAVSDRRDKTIGIDGRIVELMYLYGLRSLLDEACGQPLTRLDFVRKNLRVNSIEVPKTEGELWACMERWEKKVKHYRRYQELICRIQTHHGVSGIEWDVKQVNGVQINFPCESKELPLIDSDLEILKHHKSRVVEEYLDAIADIQL